LNLNELKELLELISEKDITEFELEEEGVKIKVKKGTILSGDSTNNHPVQPVQPVQALHAVQATQPVQAVVAPRTEGADSPPEPHEEPGVDVVRSPMVGTFYRAPEPGASPFVSEGERVKKEQVLCIIEAMKLMNEIESECAGEVIKIYVENGQPVQYGDELFAIRVAN
jgi:acetyl-CoA carboxylase biotin carboxyl carrier protein